MTTLIAGQARQAYTRPMLDARRNGALKGAYGPVLAGIWDRLVASDPGLLRLTMAIRGTASVFLMTATALLIGAVLGYSAVDFAPGVTFSLMGPFLAREPNWRQRLQTLVTLTLPAAAVTVGTAVVHGHGPAGDASFLVLVFLGFLLQGRGPQWIGLGLVAVVISYVGLFLELPVATLPVQLLSIAVALLVTAFASFILVPLRPEQTLRRTMRALQGRAARVLHDAGGAPGGRGAVRRLRTSLARLNEAALAADDQLALLGLADGPGLRAHVMDLELATAQLASAPLALAPGPGRRRHSAELAIHERRLRRNRWSKPAAGPGRGTPQSAAAKALADIRRAASALGQEVPWAGGVPPGAVPAPPGPLAWRIAFRVTLASALSMAGGMAVSPQRWFWAVITTYVVFLGTRSRGDTIYKGVQRLAGTLLGLVAGMLLADLLTGDLVTQAVVLLAAVFGMYYLFPISYTLAIFCVTVLLGLLYGLLGVSSGPLLVLRLEETAIGAVAAVLVAAFVLPVRTRDLVKQSGTAVLAALAQAVGACRGVLAGEPGLAMGPVQAMRAVDRQVADLRLALLPLTAGRVLRRLDVERSASALLDSVYWARTLAAALKVPDPGAAAKAGLIEQRLAGLAAGERSVPPIPPPRPGPAAPVAAALDQLDRATAALAERLAIGALHAFRLED